MGVERGEVPAAAGGDPAAESGEPEALRVVPDREAVGLQRRLDRRTQDAGLDARGAAGPVDLEDLVEPPQVEADRAGVAVADGRLDAANDRRAAAEGHDGDVRHARPIEHGDDVCFARRKGDQIRRVGEIAIPGPDRLRIGLAVGVQEPFVRIVREPASERAGWRHAGYAQADVRYPWWRDESRLDTEAVGKKAEQPLPLGLVEARVLHTPAIEL